MRKTIILGSILTLVGFASVAQASDRSKVSDRDATRVHSEISDDSRGDRHDRTARKEHSRDRHDESRESHDESHEQSNRR